MLEIRKRNVLRHSILHHTLDKYEDVIYSELFQFLVYDFIDNNRLVKLEQLLRKGLYNYET